MKEFKIVKNLSFLFFYLPIGLASGADIECDRTHCWDKSKEFRKNEVITSPIPYSLAKENVSVDEENTQAEIKNLKRELAEMKDKVEDADFKATEARYAADMAAEQEFSYEYEHNQ